MSAFTKATIQVPASDLPEGTDTKTLNVLLPVEKKPLPFGKQIWGTFFLNECERIAKLKLSGQQWQVLMLMLSQMSYGQMVEVSQTTLASELNIPKSRVCEAIRALAKAGILIADVKIGTSQIYRFNANFVFRGKTKFVHKQQQADAADQGEWQAGEDVGGVGQHEAAHCQRAHVGQAVVLLRLGDRGEHGEGDEQRREQQEGAKFCDVLCPGPRAPAVMSALEHRPRFPFGPVAALQAGF